MRAGILHLNQTYRDLLSNDLGAVAGFLFDVGISRFAAPPVSDDGATRDAWLEELSKTREAARRFERAAAAEREGDRTHADIQAWLRDLGLSLGYKVWVAANDRGRLHNGEALGARCMDSLPASIQGMAGAESIRLIDILWVASDHARVMAAFEVEHTTSIYSGIVRMLDLALSSDLHAVDGLFLVAPDAREQEVRTQLRRPAFSRIADLRVRFLPYGELEKHRDAIGRFGTGMKGIQSISRLL